MPMEIEKLRKLGIRNLHPVFGRGVRGETLARRGLLGNALECVREDRKSTRLNSSHPTTSRMPSSA